MDLAQQLQKSGLSESTSDCGSNASACSTSSRDEYKLYVLAETLRKLQLEVAKRDLEVAKRDQQIEIMAATIKKHEQRQSQPDKDEQAEQEAARQQLNRMCTRHANGELKVPEQLYNDWKSGTDARNRVIALFLKCGRNKAGMF